MISHDGCIRHKTINVFNWLHMSDQNLTLWLCSCSKERGRIISVQGQTISCLIGNSCVKSDEDLAHNLILKVENEFSRRSYSISWHPGLSCLPATAKGTDVVSGRGRNERTWELTGSFWKICTTVQFVWCFVSWKLQGWSRIYVLPAPGAGMFLTEGDEGRSL